MGCDKDIELDKITLKSELES